jgi:hypothetical protein
MEHLDTAKFYEWLDSLKIGAVPEGPPATRFIPWKLGCAVGSCSRRRLDDQRASATACIVMPLNFLHIGRGDGGTVPSQPH